MQEIKRVAIIGPESTGKSTLCTRLANHFNTLWCPEFAREYLLKHGTDYTVEDLLTIAKGQLSLQQEYENKVRLTSQHQNKYSLLLIDTDMYVMKVWSEYVFGKCDPFILDQVVQQKIDLYLLCNIDLPWVKDELREYPDYKSREELYHIYKDILINQAVPWVEISGSNEERTNKAIQSIEKMLM